MFGLMRIIHTAVSLYPRSISIHIREHNTTTLQWTLPIYRF